MRAAGFGDDLEGRIGLSEPMMAAVPETVVMVRELVERLRGNVLVGVPRSEYGEGSRNAEE